LIARPISEPGHAGDLKTIGGQIRSDIYWNEFRDRNWIEKALYAKQLKLSWGEEPRLILTDPLYKETTERAYDEYMTHYYSVLGLNFSETGASVDESISNLVRKYYKDQVESQAKEESSLNQRRRNTR